MLRSPGTVVRIARRTRPSIPSRPVVMASLFNFVSLPDFKGNGVRKALTYREKGLWGMTPP